MRLAPGHGNAKSLLEPFSRRIRQGRCRLSKRLDELVKSSNDRYFRVAWKGIARDSQRLGELRKRVKITKGAGRLMFFLTTSART